MHVLITATYEEAQFVKGPQTFVNSPNEILVGKALVPNSLSLADTVVSTCRKGNWLLN